MIWLPILALTACAGVQKPDDSLAAAVAQATQQESPDYKHAFVDLNDDGVGDAIVLLEGMDWCGSGGCTMLVLKGEGAGYTAVSRSTVVREPIRVSTSTSHGWRGLIVHSDGKARLMGFTGDGYPLNPSMQSAAPEAQAESAETVLP